MSLDKIRTKVSKDVESSQSLLGYRNWFSEYMTEDGAWEPLLFGQRKALNVGDMVKVVVLGDGDNKIEMTAMCVPDYYSEEDEYHSDPEKYKAWQAQEKPLLKLGLWQ